MGDVQDAELSVADILRYLLDQTLHDSFPEQGPSKVEHLPYTDCELKEVTDGRGCRHSLAFPLES